MMEETQQYLTAWYHQYHQLEQRFLGSSFSSLIDAQIMIDNFKLNQLLRDLMRHYCHFRLLRICPTATLWIRGMIWKLCCDQLCSQLPPCLPFSSDVSIYDRKFKKLISFDDFKKIIRAGKSLATSCQAHLHLTLPKDLPKDFESNFKRPCPPLSLQVNLQNMNDHFNTIQHTLKESIHCHNHEELVRYAKDFRDYHHVIDFSSEYGYIKSLCCYQNSLKTEMMIGTERVGENIETPGEEEKEETKIDQSGETQSYCYCQNPENDQLEMVYCEKCQSWYHCQCVGISKKKHFKELENANVDYICISCCVKLGQEYYYLKPKAQKKRKNEASESVQRGNAATNLKFPKIEKVAEESTV
jgi:hypothetical protein